MISISMIIIVDIPFNDKCFIFNLDSQNLLNIRSIKNQTPTDDMSRVKFNEYIIEIYKNH